MSWWQLLLLLWLLLLHCALRGGCAILMNIVHFVDHLIHGNVLLHGGVEG